MNHFDLGGCSRCGKTLLDNEKCNCIRAIGLILDKQRKIELFEDTNNESFRIKMFNSHPECIEHFEEFKEGIVKIEDNVRVTSIDLHRDTMEALIQAYFKLFIGEGNKEIIDINIIYETKGD